MVEPGSTQAGPAHVAEQPVHPGRINTLQEVRTDCRGEPAVMEPPVIADGLRGAPLFVAQVLRQELLNSLVNRTVTKLALGGKLRISHLLDEGQELLPCVRLVPRPDAPIQRTNSSVIP